MSQVDINQVLAQMRAISASAGINAGTAASETEAAGPQFGELLQDSINKVNDTQQHAKELSKAFQAGSDNVELPEVMIALQKASISFEAMTQVRNKLLSAYQEIMNMQV